MIAVFVLITGYIIIKDLIKAIRTFSTAKSFGITLFIIHPRIIICFLIATAVYSFYLVTAVKNISETKEKISDWEFLRSTEYSELFKDYYNEKLADSGQQITDFDKFAERAINRYSNIVSLWSGGIIIFGLGIINLVMSLFGSLIYITKEGAIFGPIKSPDEMVVQRVDGKLNLYSTRDREKPFIRLRPTPKNLAAVGRFIEIDNE